MRGIARWLVLVIGSTGQVHAGFADVVSASAECTLSEGGAARVCRFVVTVRHADAGWDHYANAWEVLAPDGTLLATRVLRHPHVGEQPFTRDLPNVEVPPGLTRVRIRARDSLHGFGGSGTLLGLASESPD